MLRLGIRPNLIYPIYFIIWSLLTNIVKIITSKLFIFSGVLVYTFLMFLGELIGGYFVYKYQDKFIKGKKEKNEMINSNKFSLIEGEGQRMNRLDNLYMILFLIFMTALFDFLEFILSVYYIDRIKRISSTLQLRLGCVLIITSSILNKYLLQFQIFRHHIFSLIIHSICLIIVIITEYSFQEFNGIITTRDLSLAIILSIFSYIFINFDDVIEKYLIEYDYVNPFIILFRQGVFGLIFTILNAIYENPFKELQNVHNNNSVGMFILFLFLLLLYFIFGIFKNIYRMFTITQITPMYKNLVDIIINPIYIIYYFAEGSDFIRNGKRNYLYFFTNLLLSIIFDICGLIFNEFIILFCCRLDHDTFKSISFRAESLEELNIINDDNEEKENDDTNYLYIG